LSWQIQRVFFQTLKQNKKKMNLSTCNLLPQHRVFVWQIQRVFFFSGFAAKTKKKG
jgi:hypothetical protein